MIDLHSHTTESDGTMSPAELLAEARRAGVRTLAITDHDTFAGYDQAVEIAQGVELICGIELSTKLHGQSVHLLGYFVDDPRLLPFRRWILELQAARRERNQRLIARLQDLGFHITLEEVEAKGRGMTGRPHFAQVLKEKGYVATIQQAFDLYLAEYAQAYVDRHEPSFAEGVARITDVGGVASLAHPVRLKYEVSVVLEELCSAGLTAIEAYHSDHSPAHVTRYLALAQEQEWLVTGGSDFHGSIKPGIQLGTGRDGNVRVPQEVREDLRTVLLG
jgi:3',5'-nucleoside bisphosphate phosphatase